MSGAIGLGRLAVIVSWSDRKAGMGWSLGGEKGRGESECADEGVIVFVGESGEGLGDVGDGIDWGSCVEMGLVEGCASGV